MRRARAFLLAVFWMALPAAPASGAAPAPPLQVLRQAQRDLRTAAAAAPSSSAHKLLTAAYDKLQGATVRSLWIDPGDPVAPPQGHSVFADSRTALIDLEPLLGGSMPPSAVAGAADLILAADRRLAETAIHQAAGGAGLLARAEGMILSGDRWAATVLIDLAAEQYGAAWVSAFGALLPLVVTPATNVPSTALATAAENALASHRIALSSVEPVRNQPPLTRAGLPEVLLVAPEGCAGCALESWAIVEALSQFGIFSNLNGMSWTQLAASLSRPRTSAGQAIDGTAELLTAEICEATGGAPAAVCGAAAVNDYESRLPPATP